MHHIRPAHPQDAPQILDIYAPYCATPISFEEGPPDLAELEARISRLHPAYPYLVAEREGRLEGFAYAGKHRERAAYRWTVETTIYLRENARGQGLGKKLYGRLLDILKEQGFHVALAGITVPNEASLALHRSLGFEPCALYREIGFKQGAWRDVQWLSRTLSQGPPSEPLTLDQLRDV